MLVYFKKGKRRKNKKTKVRCGCANEETESKYWIDKEEILYM